MGHFSTQSPRLSTTRILVSLACLALSLPAAAQEAGEEPPAKTASQAEKAPAYPLLDGRCGEYEVLEARGYRAAEGVTLWIFQDSGYMWLCVTLPDDSLGVVDLNVDAPSLTDALNLHVSAQLGEWRDGYPDEEPKSSTSPKWGHIEGWFANVIPVRFERPTEGGPVRHTFGSSTGREMQLAKNRFGRGRWRIRLKLSDVRGPDGEMQTLWYPPQIQEEPTVREETGSAESDRVTSFRESLVVDVD